MNREPGGGLIFQASPLFAGEDIARPSEEKPSEAARAWNNHATTLAARGHRQRAIRCYRLALRAAPRYALAHKNLGVTLHELGRFEEAAHHLWRATQLRRPYPEACLSLGVSLAKMGEDRQAALMFFKAAEQRPLYADAWYNCGSALVTLGEIEEGIVCLRMAMALRPANYFPEAHSNLIFALDFRAGIGFAGQQRERHLWWALQGFPSTQRGAPKPS